MSLWPSDDQQNFLSSILHTRCSKSSRSMKSISASLTTWLVNMANVENIGMGINLSSTLYRAEYNAPNRWAEKVIYFELLVRAEELNLDTEEPLSTTLFVVSTASGSRYCTKEGSPSAAAGQARCR